MNPRRPTLLVFTLGPRRERARRPLLPAPHGGAEVALRQACLDAALTAGREAGCRLRVSAPRSLPLPADVEHDEQRGQGFGQRLEAACLDAGRIADGNAGGPLLVVGTDVPGLTAAHLRHALEALEAEPDSVVLGPSPDGGFYLLATARPLPGLATMARWCRRDTLATLRRSLAAAGRRVVLLSPLADLDRRRDLERWLAAARRRVAAAYRRLVGRLEALLRALAAGAATAPTARPACVPLPVRAPRGPPRRAL